MSRIIGIDLGTTYSLAAVMDRGGPAIVANAEDGRLTPSVVALRPGRAPLVGQAAKAGAGLSAACEVVRSIKRKMGSDCRIKVDGRDYGPAEISSLILAKLKRDVEARLGEKVERAVITVPAYFTDTQRKATREAGSLAGLEVVRLLSEPTAAALAYGLHEKNVQKVLVWDLGGGTFDVSILELGNGFFQVKAVSGDPHLGGDDYDLRLAEHLAHRLRSHADKAPGERLRQAAELAKIELTRSERARVRLPREGGEPHECEVTRAEFEALTRDLALRMVSPTRQALSDAGLGSADIDRMILVGGATRMPCVRSLAREVLGQEPHPHTLNPDEAVALGAAVEAGILSGAVSDILLVDVTPLSLGIETSGGICARLIERNNPIPVTRSRIFTTAEDDQASVDIHVLQGERLLAKDNTSLGRFRLSGIEPQARGEAKIEVAFEIDVDGIVRVSAVDLQTETGRRVEIASLSGLRAEEVKKMIQEARACAGEDCRKKQEVEARLQAASMIRGAETAIRGCLGDGPSPGLDERLQGCERAVSELREALAAENPEALRSKTAALEERIRTVRREEMVEPRRRTP